LLIPCGTRSYGTVKLDENWKHL